MEEDLIKCGVEFCGKFFHQSCVEKISSTLPQDFKKNTIIIKDFVCPQHTCDECGITHTQPQKRLLMWRCFRCPKAFDLIHRPRDVHVLAAGIFLCITHTVTEESWPELPTSLMKQRLNKRKLGVQSLP